MGWSSEAAFCDEVTAGPLTAGLSTLIARAITAGIETTVLPKIAV
jgi:hypothetical protein